MANEKKKIKQAEERKQRMKTCPYCGSTNVENQMYQEKKGQIGAATGAGHGLFRSKGILGGASKQINGYETIVKCNDCGATWNVNPPKKKTWLYVLIGIVLFFVIISLVTGGDDTGSTGGTSSEDKAVVLSVGDTAETEKATIVLDSVEQVPTEASWYEYGTVEEGNIVYKATFTYTNTTDSDIYISESDFKLYADNTVCETVWLLDDSDINANISAGREATMSYTYKVPEDATVLEFEYDGTFGWGTFTDITYKVNIGE